MPTGQQIATAGGDSIWNVSSLGSSSFILPTWLYDYLKETVHPSDTITGYWTSDGFTSYAPNAWIVAQYGKLAGALVDNGVGYGVRPVITISKEKIS